MTVLQAWMNAHGENDVSLQKKLAIKGVELSRVQVLRIRTGQNGASKETARALESVTGIKWHEFIGAVDATPLRKREARA